jgi:hypothetical protein
LCKRWLLGTHQGGVEAAHLQSYLEEFCFRFNRRHSRARGLLFYRLLQYAAGAPPLISVRMDNGISDASAATSAAPSKRVNVQPTC